MKPVTASPRPGLLCKHRPGHGWPLSLVTALELLAGVEDSPVEKFPQAKEQINFACRLSKERVLEDPLFLLCKEVLRVRFPAKLERPRPNLIADYLHIVRCATSLEQIRTGGVPVGKLRMRGNGHAGFAGITAAAVKQVVAGPKAEWVRSMEAYLTETYPQWREHLEQTGKRLPDQIRAQIKYRRRLETEKTSFTEGRLKWLDVSVTPELTADITNRLDAVLEFTAFVSREVMLGNYNFEKHDSDVYDQFQLYYLALDRFVIVTEDRDLLTRTANSSQAGRVLSFDQFLRTL